MNQIYEIPEEIGEPVSCIGEDGKRHVVPVMYEEHTTLTEDDYHRMASMLGRMESKCVRL